MSTGDIVYKALAGDTAFSAIASDRIYPLVLPESVAFPAAAYTVTGTTRHSSHDEIGGLTQATVRVDCLAQTYASAKALASAARVALGGLTGSASQKVQGVFVEDESQDFSPDDVESRRYFVHTITFVVWHKETTV